MILGGNLMCENKEEKQFYGRYLGPVILVTPCDIAT